ncbi:hypothetical protein [Cohnella yongneupensis]|uniref:Uncharacterized protein n=1 Tax=Cohnella yongneupensis TaxID=425006 RepID=A0ABW0QYZ5_9BACL
MRKSKFVMVSMVFLLVILVIPMQAFAAGGDILTNPANGWTRYDDRDNNFFNYSSGTWHQESYTPYYNGTNSNSGSQNATVSFTFTGTAFRILDFTGSNRSSQVQYSLDGNVIQTYNWHTSTYPNYQTVLIEEESLPFGTHTVTLKKLDATGSTALLVIDAVDIKNIPPVESTGRALLEITYVSGLQQEYDLSEAEITAFINAYNAHAVGTGSVLFIVEKNFNKGPFNSRKNYIVFDKIETFEVNEYDPVTQ